MTPRTMKPPHGETTAGRNRTTMGNASEPRTAYRREGALSDLTEAPKGGAPWQPSAAGESPAAGHRTASASSATAGGVHDAASARGRAPGDGQHSTGQHRTASPRSGAAGAADGTAAARGGGSGGARGTASARNESSGTALEVRRVTVQLGGGAVLADVSLTARAGEIVGLLGPSGCGKTTLLRVISGLQPHAGDVRWRGRSVTKVPAHRRGFGLVFQDQALFPHLDVARNVSFGLRMQGRPAAARSRRVAELLEMVGLGGLSRRSVDGLSGGEAQRVALARALAPHPRLLMLDEPLSGLDRPLREQLLNDLPRILRQLRQTALFVTHDLEEALAVSDRVAVMRAGRIAQIDTPRTLYERPASEFVARFLGRANILRGTVRAGPVYSSTPHGAISAAGSAARHRLIETDIGLLPYDRLGAPGDRGAVLIRPERIDLTETRAPSDNRDRAAANTPRSGGVVPGTGGAPHTLHGTLVDTSFRGIVALATVLVGDATLQVLVPAGRTLPAAGATIAVSFDPHAAVLPLAEDRH